MRGPAWKGGVTSVWSSLRPCCFNPVFPLSRITLKHAVTRLLAGALLFLSVSLAHATAPVGATPGNFAVSPSGAATYSIPIFVPPGTNGLQPQLSLHYNSQGGNGLVGMDWSIGGLSVIHRCGATIQIDGFKGGVNYDANDKFCLDGERLIVVSGAYGAASSEYRTQHETWQKVVASSTLVGNTPRSFTVSTKDGTQLRYGVNVSGRITAQGQPTVIRVWALTSITDSHGNQIQVYYDKDDANGDYRPSYLTYGTGSVNSVYFEYEPRSDVTPLYEGGSVMKTMQRLSKISAWTGNGAALVREYRLSYAEDGAAGRSRLKSIEECGFDSATAQTVCWPGTTFAWLGTDNASFASGDTASFGGGGSPSDSWFTMADVNGDGKADAVLYRTTTGNVIVDPATDYGSFATTGFSVNIGAGYSPLGFWFTMADVSGDGMADIVRFDSTGGVVVNRSAGIGFYAGVTSYIGSGSQSTSRWFAMADIDGDGKADAVHYRPDLGDILVGLSTGDGAFATNPVIQTVVGTGGSPSDRWFVLADVDGDGRADAVLYDPSSGNANVYRSTGSGPFATGISTFLATGGSPSDRWFEMADVNGDGKADAVIYNPASGNATVYLSMGNGKFTDGTSASTFLATGGSPSDRWFKMADVNGDGKMDAVLYTPTSGFANVYLSTGNGRFAAGVPTIIGVGGSPSDRWFTLADVNGDGKVDTALCNLAIGSAYVSLSTANAYVSPYDGENTGLFPDLLTSITNGLGAQTAVTYKPLTDSSVYTRGGGAIYPYQEVQDATHVVSEYNQSNSIGNTNKTTITYGWLIQHLTANASLGFNWTDVIDPAGLKHITYFNQTFDGREGTVANSFTLAYPPSYAGSVRVKDVYNTWTPVAFGNGRTLAQLASAVEYTRELNDSAVSTTNTTYSGYDAYGNPGTVTVNFNDGWTKTTENTYDNYESSWILGKLRTSKVTATAPGQSAYRESAFTYDSATGRLLTEVIEPNRPALTLTTTYGYGLFGNRITKTVIGADLTPTSRTVETLTYDGLGQFVVERKNALNQPENFTYDERTGAVKTATDANGLITRWDYDGFGRKTKETRPDGTTTDIFYYACSDPAVGGSCPALAVTAVATQTSGAGATWGFYDVLGRVVQTNTQGFNGDYTYKETQYDNLGRVISVSHPYFYGETKHYTTYAYDTLGRMTSAIEPGPGDRETTTEYNGLSTTVTSPPTTASPSGQVKTTVKNSQGLAATVTDDAGTTTYTHDPFGNLLRVAKSYDVGADTLMTYDERGRKKTMTDPDMGAWSYDYNTLGELTRQTDAMGQKTDTTYDVLGRLETRQTYLAGSGTPETSSTWTYGTVVPEIGKLKTVSNTNANETYVYDSLSRLSSQTTSISGVTYTTNYAYDAYSRPLTLTYPITGFKLYHVYDPYGHLTEVRKDTATGLRYWKADLFDAHSRLTQETLGNNLISQRAYDHATGDLNTIQTGPSGNLTSVQNSSHIFDVLDNLTARSWWDGTAIKNESFEYDNLNRLTTVTGPANKSYVYAPNGNITSKSDVGTYSYATTCGTRPHAVCQVAGAVNASYAYDANGNMTTRAGKTIAYYAFNKPKTIGGASGTTTLTYDANFNRVLKSAPGNTTTYIGKLYEKTVGIFGFTTHKHYLYAGNNLIGTYTSGGTTNTRYFHTDHLGSVEVITDESGNVVQRLSYDAWGKRRNPNGTDATSIGAQTTRGFTRHEHDDEVGLVNMNAREYDYVLGRFIAPDAIIPGATSSQAYNRYSYAYNNPLSFTDPTGNWSLKKAIKKVFKVTKKIVDPFELRDNRYVRIAAAAVAAYYTAGAASSWFLSSAGSSAFATSAFASESLFTAYAAQTTIYVGSGIVAGSAAGAVSGGIMCGGDCARAGAKGGAVSGGIFAGANLMSEDWNAYGRIGARATAGGLSNDLQGRSFSAGFQYNAIYYGAQEWTDSLARNSGLTARDSNGKLRTDGTRNIDPNNKSIFGSIGMNLEGTNHWYENIPGVRNLIVDVSKVHDTMNSWRYSLDSGQFMPFNNVVTDSLFDVYSFAGMLPAASFTLKGPQYGAPPYGPVY